MDGWFIADVLAAGMVDADEPLISQLVVLVDPIVQLDSHVGERSVTNRYLLLFGEVLAHPLAQQIVAFGFGCEGDHLNLFLISAATSVSI